MQQHPSYSIRTLPLLICANLETSSKNSSAASWQFFICEILRTILRSIGLYLTRDSMVISFCSAFKGERTVIRTSSNEDIRNLESSCNVRGKN